MPIVRNYLSLIKFSHTIFAMPFALIGFFLGLSHLAQGPVSTIYRDPYHTAPISFYFHLDSNAGLTTWEKLKPLLFLLLLVVLCMVFARSAAMAFNRYLDRRFDALNPRTAIREIPKGIIAPQHALIFTIANCALFIATTWLINPLCFYLSPVALAVVLGYSFTKRFTALCHLILGLGLSLAPIGAYIAVTGHFALLPVLFSIAVICWVSGFDIIYALQDVEFDRSQALYSIPAWLGQKNGLRVSKALHLLSAAAVVCAGLLGHLGLLYWAGVLVFVSCLVYQHSIVRPNDLRRVNLAFMTTNGIASVVFAVFVIADLFIF